jgi:hypothetical protein
MSQSGSACWDAKTGHAIERVACCPLRLRIGLGTCRMLGELWGSIPDGRQSGMLGVLWELVDREPIGHITCQEFIGI